MGLVNLSRVRKRRRRLINDSFKVHNLALTCLIWWNWSFWSLFWKICEVIANVTLKLHHWVIRRHDWRVCLGQHLSLLLPFPPKEEAQPSADCRCNGNNNEQNYDDHNDHNDSQARARCFLDCRSILGCIWRHNWLILSFWYKCVVFNWQNCYFKILSVIDKIVMHA